MNAVKKVFETVTEIMGAVIELVVGRIINQITALIEIFVGIIDFVKAVFRGDWEAAWQAIKDIFGAIIGGIKGEIQIFIDFAKRIFDIFGVDIGNIFGNLWDGIRDGAEGFVRFFTNSIPNGLKAAVNAIINIIEALPNAFIAGINAVIGHWNNFAVHSPAVKIFGETVIPGFSFQTPDIPLFSKLKIPRLQSGGIVTRRTLAELGEAGPEAVIPLGRGLSGLGKTEVNVTVQGSLLTERALETVVSNIVTKLKRQGVI